MIRICVASENGNKLRQFGEIFSGLATDVLIYTAKELGFTEYPPEDAGTFYGNSRIKACAVRDYLVEKGEGGKYYVIADDSGISVDALGGAPGVHSARCGAQKTRRLRQVRPLHVRYYRRETGRDDGQHRGAR